MSETTPSSLSLRLRDPLSAVARKERKFLLGVSIIGISIIKARIVPTKIPALGVEFGHTDQQSLLWILGLITLYFLIAFIIYAVSDFLAWRIDLWQAEDADLESDYIEIMEDVNLGGLQEFRTKIREKISNLSKMSMPVPPIRAIFEFVLPVIVGIYTIYIVWSAAF